MEELYTYDTVMIPISTGEEKEFAIMEEFDLDGKHYIMVSPVEGEEILDDCYVYQAVEAEDGLEISQIEDEDEFAKVAAFVETL